MTKGELRDLFLRYLDEATANGVDTTEDQRKDYKDKFNHFLNGALMFVAGQIKTVKDYTVMHDTLKNSVANGFDVRICPPGKMKVEGFGSSYYFELRGIVDAFINLNGNEVKHIANKNVDTYTPYKGYLSPNSGVVTLAFEGQFGYAVKNIAVYPYSYSGLESDVPVFGREVAYTMPKDFRELKEVVMETSNGEFVNFVQYTRQGENVFRLPYDLRGQFHFYYYANPTVLLPAALDSVIIDMPDKTLPLIALKTAYDAMLVENSSLASWLKGIFDNELSNTVGLEIASPKQVHTLYKM